MAAPKILLVDDNQELLVLLARLIETEGWTPVPVAKGKLAIERISAERPAAAVVDVLLPDMMGYDVAAALRNAGVPFVFMTGVFKGGRAANDARAQHGASGYFEKPFEARKLVLALRELVAADAASPAPAASVAPSPAGERTPPPAAEGSSDFDVEVAVEADEPLDALELTGRVIVTGEGKVAAVLKGDNLAAAPLMTPAHPFPAVKPPPRPAAAIAAPASAPRPRPPAADLSRPEGELGENLPALITAFHLAQQTGELTLQKGKVKKTLYFERGRPCFAISNLVNDRFGPFLARVGKITDAQLAAAQAEAEASARRTSDVLLQTGVLRESDLLYYVGQQVKAIVYSVFGWEEGQYRLHFAGRAAKEAIKVDLHPANLIVRGVKKLYKPERLRRLLSPGDRLVPTQEPAYPLAEVELERWEAEILPSVDGRRTVADLMRLARRPEHVVLGSLYALHALKLLDRA